MIEFVRETQGIDFVGAVEWLAERFRIPLEYEESSPLEDAPRERVRRLHAAARGRDDLLRALPLGVAGGVARAGVSRRSRARRGDLPRVQAGARARERNAQPQGAREGLHGRRAPRGRTRARARGGDYFDRRLVFPLADARGRVLGFQARRLYDDDPLAAKYVNTPESRAVLEARGASTGSTRHARSLRARIAPASSRGTRT